MPDVSPLLFKAYDMRGIVGDILTTDVAFLLGRAFASEAAERGEGTIVVARDGRLSGPALAHALSDGIRAAGLDVIDIGEVTTPMMYFATETLHAQSGVVVTGSHNPPDYNGFKMVMRRQAIYGESIQKLRMRILDQDFLAGSGGYQKADVAEAYVERIISDIHLTSPVRLAVDAGNGVAGGIAPKVYRALGCHVDELHCTIDGSFPNHHPDPAQPENLRDLVDALASGPAELGFAFDGDGDRLGVVTKSGKAIFPDRQLILFAEEVLRRHLGAQIIFDVKCTRNLARAISAAGGVPVMHRTGHSLIKAALRETGAPLAGEMSGHIFFKDRWFGFDDGIYAGARLLEILDQIRSHGKDINHALESLPDSVTTPELQLKLPQAQCHSVIEGLRRNSPSEFKSRGASEVHLIDGLRVDYPDGFGLARASNTTPVIVLRFEGDNEAALARIQNDFRELLLRQDSTLQMPY